MKFYKIRPTHVFWLIVIGFFWTSAYVAMDPDFGWHLSMGKLIADSGIPQTDPFSYTMKSFPFIDHEWLTNLMLWKVYPIFGKTWLSFFYSLLALAAVFLAIGKKTENKNKDLVPNSTTYYVCVILGIASIFSFFGVRPQVESWFLFSVLILLTGSKHFKKYGWVVPILVLVWTNLHGSFAVSLVYMFIAVTLNSIEERRIDRYGLIIFCLSVLATFVNPYGLGVWREVWQQISDTQLRWRIMEWKPAVFNFNTGFWMTVAASVFLIYKYKAKFRLSELGLNLFFLFQAISSVRHIPLWVLIDTPMLYRSFGFLKKEVAKVKYGNVRFVQSMRFLSGFVFLIMIFEFISHLYGSSLPLREDSFYPKEAVSFLKRNLQDGQIFSQYGWGGYLIWKLPEKKVFIDGRMPSWKWEKNVNGESKNAMDDYLKIMSGEEDYKNEFAKYGIDMVLLPVHPLTDPFYGFERHYWNFFKPIYNFLGIKRTDFDITKKLKEDGWVVKYSDSVSILFVR